jgi:hypothetical protein
MNYFADNLELIRSTWLHNMSVEEAVAADANVDSKFHRSKGVWWREVKPFFYQPAAFLTPITPHAVAPAPYVAIGGYYHVVPGGCYRNGSITVNEIADPAQYDLVKLERGVRYNIRRALTRLRLGKVKSIEILLGDGHRIYSLWEEKFKDLRVKRSDPDVFRAWAMGLLAHPHELILGAFDGDRLVAYIIAHAVEGVGDLAKTLTDPEYYHLTPASALTYSYVKICGNNPRIGKACNGLRSLNVPLEEYKARLGFRPVSYPAYISIPAPIRPLARWFFPAQYRRLMGQYDETSDGTVNANPVKGATN